MTVVIILILVALSIEEYQIYTHGKILEKIYQMLAAQKEINANVSKKQEAIKRELTVASNNAYSAKMGTESVRAVVDKVYSDVHKACGEAGK